MMCRVLESIYAQAGKQRPVTLTPGHVYRVRLEGAEGSILWTDRPCGLGSKRVPSRLWRKLPADASTDRGFTFEVHTEGSLRANLKTMHEGSYFAAMFLENLGPVPAAS